MAHGRGFGSTCCFTPAYGARAGSIKAEKNGMEEPVIILPVLQTTLDAGPCGDLSFIVGENGRPLTKESFGNEFRDACKTAGVPGSAHGVRKLAATRMANNGATEAQLMAVFGWTDPKMAAHYTHCKQEALGRSIDRNVEREWNIYSRT